MSTILSCGGSIFSMNRFGVDTRQPELKCWIKYKLRSFMARRFNECPSRVTIDEIDRAEKVDDDYPRFVVKQRTHKWTWENYSDVIVSFWRRPIRIFDYEVAAEQDAERALFVSSPSQTKTFSLVWPWLWLSGWSSRFQNQRSAVRIQASARLKKDLSL